MHHWTHGTRTLADDLANQARFRQVVTKAGPEVIGAAVGALTQNGVNGNAAKAACSAWVSTDEGSFVKTAAVVTTAAGLAVGSIVFTAVLPFLLLGVAAKAAGDVLIDVVKKR
jgi:hypothetical protein